MDEYDAMEAAYNRGYEAGKKETATVTVHTIFTRVLFLYQSLTKTEKEVFGFENKLLDLAQEFGLDIEKETITKPKE